MHYLEHTLASIFDNLALDEALLLRAEQGGPQVLRIWEWPTPAVVLGAACRLQHDVREPACRTDQVPISRRSSGGGTVLLGQGCLLYSLVLRYDTAPELAEVRPSYRWILEKIQDALSNDAAPIQIEGISDLAINKRKFSGNAQQRKRDHLLHHGSILYDFDLSAIERYLNTPERAPEYRRDRGHAEFVVNLPMARHHIVHRLRVAWQADDESSEIPTELVAQLAAEKYALESWVRRR